MGRVEPGLQGPRGWQWGRRRLQGRRWHLLKRGRRVHARLPSRRAGQPQTAVVQLADVLLEVKVPAEALATRGTGEGLLVVVSVHVEGEIVNLVESLVADIALELLLPTVGQLVVFVIP